MAGNFRALSVSALQKSLAILSVCLLPSANQYFIQVQRCCEASFIHYCSLKDPDTQAQLTMEVGAITV